MKALVFHHNFAREAAAKLSGEVNPKGFVGRWGPVALEDIAEPVAARAGLGRVRHGRERRVRLRRQGDLPARDGWTTR